MIEELVVVDILLDLNIVYEIIPIIKIIIGKIINNIILLYNIIIIMKQNVLLNIL